MPEIAIITLFIAFGLIALVIWILTIVAFVQRLNKARANGLRTTSEFLKFAFAPFLTLLAVFVGGVTWVFRKLSNIFLVLLLPLWILLFLFTLALTFYPVIFDFISGRLGIFGEKILTYNEELPQRTVQHSKESWSSFMGNFTLLMAHTPLKRLLSYQESIWTFNRLGLRDKAIAVLRAQALDPKQNLQARLNAVWGLGKQGQVDDLLQLTRNRDLTPEVAHSVVNWLESHQKQAEVIQAWNFLGLHHDQTMQLEAAQNLMDLNQTSQARRILFCLFRDEKAEDVVRIRAAEAAWELAAPASVVPILENFLHKGQNESVRLAAAESLWRMNQSEAALVTIFRCLDPNLDFNIRKQAINTLGRLQLKRELILVKANPFLSPEDWREAAYVLETLGDTSTAFVSWLSLARNEKAPTELRIEALAAAERLGEGRMNELGSEAFCRIREFICHIGYQETYPAALRFQAAQTLGNLGWQNDASALFLILANRKNKNTQVQGQAAQALKRLRGQGSLSY